MAGLSNELSFGSQGYLGCFHAQLEAAIDRIGCGGWRVEVALRGFCLLIAGGLYFCSVLNAQAQFFQCPPGTTQVPGGGGIMCQCPDGSFWGVNSGCSNSGPSPQEVGDHCRNGGTCPVGTRCSIMPGKLCASRNGRLRGVLLRSRTEVRYFSSSLFDG